MFAATSELRKEHEAILKMLQAAEETSRQLESGAQVTSQRLEGLLEFFTLFADRCHHGKEEDLLFPILRTKGLPSEGGPIAVMLYEHDAGRAFVRQLKKATADFAAGNGQAAGEWVSAARSYSALLRDHIEKENQVLFVLAENLLSEKEQGDLAEKFAAFESQSMGRGTHERLHAAMNKIMEV